MTETHGLHAVLSFLDFWALFTFFGLCIARIWLVPAGAFEAPDLLSRWRQMLNECLGLLTFAAVMLLLVRTAEMSDGTFPDSLSDLPDVLTKTHFGSVWSVHLLTLVCLWVGCSIFSSGSSSKAWTAIVVVGMAALAFTYSATSHAGNAGDFTLSELNDWVHVISTSLWGGAIFACALLVFPMLRTQDSLISGVAIRLSNLAGVALAIVLITGIYNAILRLPDWKAFTATNYGRVLAVKLAAVAVVILIGAFNRLVVIPRIRRHAAEGSSPTAPVRLIFGTLMVDAAFVVLAIIAAAVLIQIEPAGTADAQRPSSVYGAGGGDQ